MKRVLALILVLLLLGTLCACGGGSNTETTPETTLAPAVETKVAEPLTWEKINSLPIANDSMSEDELRQLCMDFMEMTMLFPWTPSDPLNFTPINGSDKVTKIFVPGEVYGGPPYIAGTMGNIYTMMEYYDERNGMLDLSGGMDTLRQFCNQCSGSTFWAWNRVCNKITYNGTTNALQHNGCIRVGPYTYDDNIMDMYREQVSTKQICQTNGLDTMYESYALLKPADGIVNFYSGAGHVRMVFAEANVVRDANGKINGGLSTITYTDQDGLWYQHTQPDGSPYEHVGGYKIEITFFQLFNDGYLPFTFAEFIGADPVEKSETTIDYTGDTITTAQLMKANISSNYSISDVTIVIKDKNGKQVFRNMAPAYKAQNAIPVPTARVEWAYSLELENYADGKHTVEISARIGTGEKPVVYTGTLVG